VRQKYVGYAYYMKISVCICIYKDNKIRIKLNSKLSTYTPIKCKSRMPTAINVYLNEIVHISYTK